MLPSRRTGVPFVALLAALSVAAVLVAAAPVAAAPSAEKTAKPVPHPAVDAAESCEECHAQLTPKPYRLWFDGRHGLMGVKCVVCHGSVGSGFTKRPKADGCGGCHGEKAAAMAAPFFKGKSCFSCHHPHALNPHAAASGGAK